MGVDLGNAARYIRHMEAAHLSSESMVIGRLRRYVLDSLATGRSLSIKCGSQYSAQLMWELGNHVGAQPTIRQHGRSWNVELEAGVGAMHFDLYHLG